MTWEKSFKDHVATYRKIDDNLETLEFRNPGTSIHAVWFVRQYGVLMVFGDIFEATYMWSWDRRIDLNWMADTNFGYFVSKCRASPHGREPKLFDSNHLRKELEELFDKEKTWCSYEDEELNEIEKRFEEDHGWRNIESYIEWNAWLYENADEVFGADWHEFVPDGRRYDDCMIGHHVALKMAMEQIKKGEISEK